MKTNTTNSKQHSTTTTALSLIKVDNRKLREITQDALEALKIANNPPEYFVRSGVVVRFRADEQMRLMLEEVDDDMLINRLARVADFYKKSVNGQKTPCDPPLKVAKDILALGSWPYPPIVGIVEAPILRPDGSIMMTQGYDEQTSLYYYPAPGFEMEAIAESPTQKQIMESRELLLNTIMDFPFNDKASLANMLGLLITPLARPVINGCVPLALIDSPQAGTGKTLLGTIVAIIATGHNPSMMPYSQGSEELRKKVTSTLRADANVILLDNIRTELNSEILASALTSTEWGDRLLGRNEMLRLPQRATWIANGNNLHLGGDMPRRCFSIQLDAELSQPWRRSGFTHSDLSEWVSASRSELMRAIFVLIRAWVSAGKPDFSGPKLGSFTNWCKVIGGILEVTGVSGFLSNLDQMYDYADEEGSQWETFLLGLQDHFHEEWFSTAQVCDLLMDLPSLVDALPDELGSPFRSDGGIDQGFKQKLGIEFGKRVHTRFGSRQMYLDHKRDNHSKAARWRIFCGEAGTCGTCSTEFENQVVSDDKP